jgi:predicted dehydrogenase
MSTTVSASASSRREFLKQTSAAAAVTALAGITLPHVHAAESHTIQLALVGCGGRGTGAVVDAFSVKSGPVKLVAMADVFEARLSNSFNSLKRAFPTEVEVPGDRKFVGLDSYKQAMDVLRPGDVVILATPPAFRWVHFQYAISKGLNVFMEKPVTVDGPTSKRMLALGEESVRKNLKVGVGLMCRHCEARQQLFAEIKDGKAGDITFMRAYRMHPVAVNYLAPPQPPGISELMYQIQRFHAFLWSGGGAFSDFYIHNIDECCWMKDAWPVRAEALGGRHYRGDSLDQNLDTYSVEYTFADGTKFFFEGRVMSGCVDRHASYAHGTKGLAVISAANHAPARCRILNGHDLENSPVIWRSPREEPNPYQLEWKHLLHAIRNDLPFNEVKRGVEASVVTSMGRMAAHTGQIVTFDDMLNHEHEFAPGLDKLTADSPAPLQLAATGKYPVPQPGLTVKREY